MSHGNSVLGNTTMDVCIFINVTCSNEMSRMSLNELDFEKTPHKHATMISDGFDFLSPKYTLISFLSIGDAYFSFSTFCSFFQTP